MHTQKLTTSDTVPSGRKLTKRAWCQEARSAHMAMEDWSITAVELVTYDALITHMVATGIHPWDALAMVRSSVDGVR